MIIVAVDESWLLFSSAATFYCHCSLDYCLMPSVRRVYAIEMNENIMDASVFIVRALLSALLCSIIHATFCSSADVLGKETCMNRASFSSALCVLYFSALPLFVFRLLIFIYIYNGVDVVLVGVCSFFFPKWKNIVHPQAAALCRRWTNGIKNESKTKSRKRTHRWRWWNKWTQNVQSER